MSRFVHLHTHSHYSFLEALPKVDELVDAAVEKGMDAVALTDAGNMHGAIELYKAATKRDIKPILGVDLYMAPRSRFDKDPVHDAKRSRIVLLAENNEGYQNLLALVTAAHTEGFFDKPRIDRELLKQHAKGVIAILPSFAGDVVKLFAAGDRDGAAASLAEYQSIMGEDNLFLEITHHPKVEGHTQRMEKIITLGQAAGVPLVAQHDVYYIKPDDREATEVMRRIKYGSLGTGGNEDEDFSFVDIEDIDRWFGHVPGAVDASGKIAARCNVTFELGKWTFPNVPLSEGFKSHGDELRAKAYAGLETRSMERTPEVEERIEYELNIIAGKGFAPYFLVVSDLLNHAKEEGILTTTRGSAAGSLVSYLTGITNVDRLAYKLPFERFLNPERPKAPDIDMDMADNRRDDMIRYVKEKYGESNVAQIGTFGTLMARAAVRDVSRALGHPYGMGDRIAKLIPLGSQGFPMTIDKALELEPDLKSLYEEDEDAREILDLSRRIEGCVRHVGVHAAGVVISPTPLVEWTPLQPDPKGTGKLITQYDMYSITDEYGGGGLLKFDFLGLRNLSIIADTVERINKIEGIKIDIENIPLDDKKTFDLLSRGETEGTFQLNGNAMTKFLMELKPSAIHDIHAMVALYRPGPMQFIPLFIERKHNPSLVPYPDPALKPILERTYGILVYQDDLLMIAHDIAGYSWGEVDKFRKAVGKKIPAEMAAQKEKFIRGCIEHSGWRESKAQALWDWIEPFAAYGFNKAHSVSYGHVAYQTAWLKANFPAIYMSAVLTAESGDVEKIGVMIKECSRMGIEVLPPSINESFSQFTVVARNLPAGRQEPYRIRFCLTTIKNFGEGISSAITAERKANGKFKDLADFLDRIKDKNLNKKSLEALIKCGALDEFDERGILLSNIDNLLGYHRERLNAPKNQETLFGLMADNSTIPVLRLTSASTFPDIP